MMDEAGARKTEARLKQWDQEIKRREARLLTPGREARFAAVLHVDELKVLLATARARFEALQADPAGNRDLLASEFDRACKELAAAVERRMPLP